ncbi:PREDICTED: pantothenate kinase 4-like [Acropora digitifera]|uniref:pantothenate kinase 4-like n=1 Tax=Acropora digitifera TaxID=70779 RepID=UPI000779FAF1|nr:PREDICTED: pantothenate kinase 4-like [Acropora digitifera]
MDFKTNQESSSGYARSISLPEVFRNLKTAKIFAVDIGGSLAKVAYMSEVRTIRKRHFSFTSLSEDEKQEKVCERAATGHIYEIKEDQESSLRLHFIKFETKYIEMCVNFIQENILSEAYKDRALKATGGGAYKYIDLLTSKLGCRVDKEDEMECLIRGCNFLLRNISNEVFEFHREQKPPYVFQDLDHSELFPYLLVNIGSGVSIVKVLSETQYERVGGTSMGGGTFWGLGSLLTSAKGFDELLELATKGHHQNVDMLVRDIYGGAYEALKLPGDLTASSFGKTVRSTRDDFQPNHAGQFAEADIAKSLLHMISNDIGQIASLYAKLNGLKKIYFSGYFIRGNPVTMHTISYGINYWSKVIQLNLSCQTYLFNKDLLLTRAYGNLSVRSLLDVREQYLNEFNFPDPYAEVGFNSSYCLYEISFTYFFLKFFCLCITVLSVLLTFSFHRLMENGSLDFETSMKKLQARPWLRDDLDDWIARSKGPPHKLAVIFVDNSGVDIILGMFPFIRELLSRGTKVVMAANSYPALNDVMYSELVILTESVANLCPEIRTAYDEKRLVPMESGIGSPCLDCRRVNTELALQCTDADLLILEGMGRAVHTNYDAKFTCESIKLAAIKNRWLAKRLGGDMYSVVFRYEQGTAP